MKKWFSGVYAIDVQRIPLIMYVNFNNIKK